MTNKNAQFVLLAIEAWERLHALDALLEGDDDAKAYHALLYDRAGHRPKVDLPAFRDPGLRMIFGPQALVLLLPAVGALRAVGKRKPGEEAEQELERLGIKAPASYGASLKEGKGQEERQRKKPKKKPKPSPQVGAHPRNQMISCIRNAAAHHMESLLSEDDSGQGILMPEDGARLELVSDDFELMFSGLQWQVGYIALLGDIIASAKNLVKPWIRVHSG